MTDYFDPPNISMHESFGHRLLLSSYELELLALCFLVAGLVITLVASIVLSKGPRRHLAVGSLICVAIMAFDVAIHWPRFPSGLMPAMALVLLGMIVTSIVNFPVWSRWVNWPLAAGCISGPLVFIVASVVAPGF